ncbi:MAG: S41 family peptidase [Elainellaceae cyanobacterium]
MASEIDTPVANLSSGYSLHDGHTRGYYRFPTLHHDTIVFTAEGDLWSVGVQGGIARRLTTHHGVELNAAISPDGDRIAFSAEYEGPREVYSMPVYGGRPTRHTYEGDATGVVGWTPDGQILYSTMHYSTLPNVQLATLNVATGQSTLLPLSQASDGCFTADGQTLFFTRLEFQGSHTKRYKGGTAQNIWTFAIGACGSDFSELDSPVEAIALTADYPGTSKNPMWWDGRVYFASDRDGTMNLWSMNEAGADLRQHTAHKGWDIQSPALHNGRIVYQLGADLHLYTIAADTDETVDIELVSDFDQTRERWLRYPMAYLTSAHLSPKGDRLVLTARGRVFVAPAAQGRLVEATRESRIRYRNARFLPDGKTLIALTDETGELEFCQIPANGIGSTELLTTDGDVFRYTGLPSPDGKRMVFGDKDQRLWLFEFETHTSRCIAESDEWGSFFDWRWSPDSRFLAYVAPCANQFSQICIYSLEDDDTFHLTSDRVDSFSPSWSTDGKWMYFLSDRHFTSLVPSPWGPRQPEPYFDKTTQIYHVALVKGERSPFQPMDELYQQELERKEQEEKDKDKQAEAEAEAEAEAKTDSDVDTTGDSAQAAASHDAGSAEKSPEHSEESEDDDDSDEDTPAQVTIEREGLQRRVMEVPVEPGNYSQLCNIGDRIFWQDTTADFDSTSKLMCLELKPDPIEPRTVMDDIWSYELSLDSKKLLIRKNGDFYVIDSDKEGGKDKELEKKKVDLSNWAFSVQPREEWRQMLVEAWRMERDYFYDRNMHGVNWKGLLDRHLPLVDRVTDRDELSDLIAHMVGELAALHTFVGAGDRRKGQDRIRIASLGAALRPVETGYRVDYLYQHDPDYPERAGPLTRPEVDLQVGDIIESINGIPTLSVPDPAVLLKNQADQQVLLQVRSTQPEASNLSTPNSSTPNSLRQVIVTPCSTYEVEDLRYGDWEYRCRQKVEAEGEGRLGYVHLQAMGCENYTEWVENYYPVFNREGLIIDVRHNRGGNIDSWILEKLLRKAWFFWKPRIGKPFWNMQWAFRGHMVVLCNEKTASDGEAFTEGFRRLGLGKVIGTRTWGGEIWLSLRTWLVDRGFASAAEIGVYGPEGEWLIEGHGVEPDMVVDNPPHHTFKGGDAQLDAAIAYLKQRIEEEPIVVPPPPEYPNKSFSYE